MGFAGMGLPVQAAEAARIREPQQPAAKGDVHMVVLADRGVVGDDPQTPGHPQVQDQHTGLQMQQEVLGSSGDADDALAGKVVRQ